MKMKIIGVLIVAILLVFVFYWFQVRPANIRSSCNDHVISGKATPDGVQVTYDVYENYYKICLRSKGINN